MLILKALILTNKLTEQKNMNSMPNMCNIDELIKVVNEIRNEYIDEASGVKCSKRWLQDFNKEVQELKQYRGREILELLQNADDANSDKVIIEHDTKYCEIKITNCGNDTKLFSNKGFESILFANLSSKQGQQLIGEKGLGFRSVLNWSSDIEICSGNVSLKFSEEIACECWQGMKAQFVKNSVDLKKLERLAESEHRKVPLAILALPKVQICDDFENKTIITLKYHPDKKDSISAELRSLKAYSLLFLHHLKDIRILENGSVINDFRREDISCVDDITKILLNDEEWIICSEKGISSGKRYEVSCAYAPALDGGLNEPVYTFFPTDVWFNLPCILHATFNLDSSRKSLIAKDEENRFMVAKLSECMKMAADYIMHTTEGKDPNWDAFRFMRPNRDGQTQNEYCKLIYDCLYDTDGDFVPVLCGGYSNERESFFYNKSLFDFLRKDGKSAFANMCYPSIPEYAKSMISQYDKYGQTHIERYAQGLKSYSRLAEFIKLLVDFSKAYNRSDFHGLNILIDKHDRVIKGKAYLNNGGYKQNIPDFRDVNYVNEGLRYELNRTFNSDIGLINELQKILDVSVISMSEIRNILRPKRDDDKLTVDQRRQLIVALYRVYESEQDSFPAMKDCYLFNDDNEWVRADLLILADRRFPKGFDNLNLKFSYPSRMCVEYPTYVEEDEYSNSTIQEFFMKLGVNPYFKRKEVCFSVDYEYLKVLQLNNEIFCNEIFWNCQRDDVNSDNTLKIADLEDFINSNPTTNEMLKLVFDSGYVDEVCLEKQKLYWFHYKKRSTPLETSYKCFSLKNVSAIKELKNYILDEKKWLYGGHHEPIYKIDDRRMQLLVLKLGAKEKLSDFTPDELYEAINVKAKWCESNNNYRGVGRFYDDIKQALYHQDAKPISANKRIMMVCKMGEELQIKDSRDIYYSDNLSLPKKMWTDIPLLELQGRAGEEQVVRFFGCKTLKDIKINIRNEWDNDLLTKDLNDYILRLKPFILAQLTYESNDDKKFESKRKEIEALRVAVVSELEYEIILEPQGLPKANFIEENETVFCGGIAFICSTKRSATETLRDPTFLKALNEIICITLKISYKTHSDFFTNLFKSNEEERRINFIEDKFKAVWPKCVNAFGASVDEVHFWSKVAKLRKWDFDISKFEKNGTSYLYEFGIKPDVATKSEYQKWYLECLTRCRDKYRNEYCKKVHAKMVAVPSEQEKYLMVVGEFQQDGWIKDLIKESDNIFKNDSEEYFDSIVREAMANKFQFYPKSIGDVDSPKKHPEYLEFVDESKLTEQQKSLLYFEGHYECFHNLRHEVEGQKTVNINTEEIDCSVCSLDKYQPEERLTDHKNYEFKAASKRVSEDRRKALGDRAENMVFQYMKDSENYYDIRPVSKSLNPENGDDSKGYDLSYRCKEDEAALSRLLEIKSSEDGKSFRITKNELEVAENNLSRYDIALVKDKQIRIISAAVFLDKSKCEIVPNNYTVYYSINENEH